MTYNWWKIRHRTLFPCKLYIKITTSYFVNHWTKTWTELYFAPLSLSQSWDSYSRVIPLGMSQDREVTVKSLTSFILLHLYIYILKRVIINILFISIYKCNSACKCYKFCVYEVTCIKWKIKSGLIAKLLLKTKKSLRFMEWILSLSN